MLSLLAKKLNNNFNLFLRFRYNWCALKIIYTKYKCIPSFTINFLCHLDSLLIFHFFVYKKYLPNFIKISTIQSKLFNRFQNSISKPIALEFISNRRRNSLKEKELILLKGSMQNRNCFKHKKAKQLIKS